MALGFGPISSIPVGALPHQSLYILAQSFISFLELTNTLFAATVPFISRATDTPANQPFQGTLETSFRVDRSILGGNGFGGFSENVSELSLINADGFYDELADVISVNGQSIQVSIGEITGRAIVAPYSNFETVVSLTGERVRTERSHMVVEMRDPALRLQTETVQQSVYLGIGDLEGGAEIAGKRRPYGDGVIFNATPTLVIPGELLYQFNDGAVASVEAVKDGGVELTFFADYPTVAALRADGVAASPDVIPPGTYATCLAEGYFLLGGVGFKQITVDFTGGNTITAWIIGAIAINSAGMTTADFDLSTFYDLVAAQPAPVGYFLSSDSSETCADAFTKLMTGIGGWWGMTPLGKLQLKRMERPSNIASAYYDTDGGNIVEINRGKLPSGIDPPPHRWRVIYGRNYTVMTDLFGQVSENDPAMADYLKSPYKLASTSDLESQSTLSNWPDAPDPDPVESYFALQADAQAEAERLFALYTIGLSIYQFTLKNALFVHDIGEVINVTDSRLGLSGGRYLRIVELSDDVSAMTTEVTGFG
jgi:hypothetical protein